MRRPHPALFVPLASPLLGLLGGCGGDGTPTNTNTAAETGSLVGITAAHNQARASVMPAPSTAIPPLTWSESVAATAQAWASRCQFGHNPDSPYGENIFASSGQTPADAVVADWVAEKKNYDYAANRCSGGTCGHYTQVVWAKSLRLGCAVQNCTKNSPFGGGSWQLWVCGYDPPGNFGGQRPY